MNRRTISLIAAAALAGASAALPAQAEDATRDERLADAQRRLEDAAREIAELSAEGAGPEIARQFEYFIGPPRRAMLGINLGGAEPNGAGVRVEGVSPGGPAEEAGVKPGDVIVAIAATPVATGRELVRAMETVEPGEKLELTLRRDGKPVKLTVEPRAIDRALFVGAPGMPAISQLPALPDLPQLHWLLKDWGDAEFVTMTPGLGRYFGADQGVLVVRAPRDAALGLQEGDVILAIGGREPQSASHAMRILRSYQPGEAVELKVMRDRRTQTLTSTIPERGPRDVLRRAPVQPRRPVPPPPPEPAAPT